MSDSSKLFTGFRALGFTSNHVPLVLRYSQKQKENYVVTSIGKAFHTYNCSRLGISTVSDSHPNLINCLACNAYLVFTGCGKRVCAYSRGKHVEYEYEGHEADVHLLLPFGNHLISVDEKSHVNVWDIKSQEIYTELSFSNDTFQITTVVHPSTYLNKILFGSKQGTLQLWNIRSNKLLYTFSGWNSPITALEQAPAVDVVAVGLADGRIILHNLRYDETVMTFKQDWGPVTAISFRTDGHPIMATGSTIGHIALWNLQEKKLQSQMLHAHTGAVSGMKCLPSEPLLITSGGDNALKVWIFDQPDGGGRLLRQRSGHSAPPNKVRFHDKNGHNLLSAGQDSTLQSFSTVHDRHNRSLGRASFNKKESKKSGLRLDEHMMPPITDFASEPSRQSDWDCIAACHRSLKEVTTWNYNRFTMGKNKLLHPRFKDEKTYGSTTAQCVTITSCGNFALIGYSSGHVDMYNLQSGLHRGSYGQEKPAHNGCIRGIAVDGLNQITVTGGADKCVKFWRFKSRSLLESVEVESQVSSLTLHRESAMLAVATDDFTVIVIDIETRKIIRRFSGHRNSITDMTFSPDARWLVTSSMDASVRTWDLPTGSLVDCFIVDTPVTSMSLSPLGDFLATTHVDDLGIYLWSNKSLYTHVSLRPLPADYEPTALEMPSTSLESRGLRSDDDLEENVQAHLLTDFKSPEQISDELVTLSLLPDSRWKNLLSLDIIKLRNKPKQPPKVPKSAPFFLPTIAGLEPKFAPMEEDKTEENSLKKVIPSSLAPLSPFGQLLWNTQDTNDYDVVLAKMKEMGPSAVDVELRSLAPEAGGSVDMMAQFMGFLDKIFATNRDFELAQAYLGLFMKLHGDSIASEPLLTEQAKILQESQGKAWRHLQELFNQNLCLVNYLRSATL